MKRTRKWEYVKQEAMRLAELGLGSQAIATRIEVDLSTVNRWFRLGKLVRRGRVTGGSEPGAGTLKSPAEWAASVRAEYSLSETDDQLVALGESALVIAHNPLEMSTAVLAAIRTFQGVAKQLALVAKVVEVAADEQPERPEARVLRPTGTDPRVGLMVVQ